MQYQTRDLEEAVHVVGSVYCPHELSLDRRAAHLDTRVSASATGRLSRIQLAYGAHVAVDAGEFPDLYLFMRCTFGEGAVRQGSVQTRWSPGATVPVSAWHRTQFDFSPSFSQSTFRPDTAALEACCGRLLGRPLEDSLSFELTPFAPAFEQAWGGVLGLLEQSAGLPEAAQKALEEFVLTSLLTGHPHNHTKGLQRQQPVSRPARLVGRAEAFIRQHIDDTSLTVSELAQALGVSVRALQSSFQEQRQLTPTAYLRQIRLGQVRERLLDGVDGDKVIDIALAHGFFHLGRFAQHYKAHFGESPSETLRSRTVRARRATRREGG